MSVMIKIAIYVFLYVYIVRMEKSSFLDCPNLDGLKLDRCSDQDIENLLGKARIVAYMKKNEVAHTDDSKSAIQGYVNEIERLQHIIRKLKGGEEVPASPSSTTATIDDPEVNTRVGTNGWWLRHLPSVTVPFAKRIAANGGRKLVNSRRRGVKMARTCRRTRRGGYNVLRWEVNR